MASEKSHSEQAGILVFGKVFVAISEALVLLIIVRLLGKHDVGVLGGVLLVYQTLALIVTAGFPSSLMYHLPGRPAAERRAVAWKVVRVLFGLGFLAGLLLLALGQLGDLFPSLAAQVAGSDGSAAIETLRYASGLALLPMVDLPARILPNFLVVEGRPRASAGVGVIWSLGRTMVVILPISLGAGIWTVIWSMVAFGWAYGLLIPYYFRDLYRDTERVPAPLGIKDLFRFAVPLGLTDTVSMLNNRLDRYLILLVLPITRFAEYQAGAWQIPLITQVPYAVGTVYAPRFTKLFKEGRAAEALAIWRHSISKVALLVMPVSAVFIVAAEETMELLFTQDYRVAANVFRLYALLTLGRVAAFGTVIVSAGRPGYVFQAALFSLLSNVVLSTPLVFLIGFEGPALGTFLAFIPMVIFYCWCIARASGLRFREIFPLLAFSKVLALTAVSCSGAVAIKLALDLDAAVMFGLEAASVLGLFALLGTLLGLIGREDWRFITDWLRLKMLRSDA